MSSTGKSSRIPLSITRTFDLLGVNFNVDFIKLGVVVHQHVPVTVIRYTEFFLNVEGTNQ